MSDTTLSRRSVMKAMMLGSAVPWTFRSALAGTSCSDHIVRVGGVIAPDTMNPFASWSNWWPLAYTYDCLVGVEAQRYDDRRGFAKSWSVADDNVTWTFKIWPGMKWSDGHIATANDVAFTYNYLLKSIGTPDELTSGFNDTSGFDLVQSITVVDAETLQIVTKTPSRWALDNFKFILPEHIWKDISYADARGNFRNDPPVVGTGPMIISEFRQGQFVRFTPNPYFRTGKSAVAGMVFQIFDNADPVAQGLKSGTLDLGFYLTPSQWADLSKDSSIDVGQLGTEQRDFLAFNTLHDHGAGSTKALQDPAFRDAIGYAIDQTVIANRAYRGNADPGVGLVMPSVADYYSGLPEVRRHFDLAEAGRRLDAAGYRDQNGDGVREDKEGKAFLLELITGISSCCTQIPSATVQLIAEWLGQIGIPVSVTQLDSGALGARTAAPAKGGGGWDLLVRSDWIGPSAHDILSLGKSGELVNPSYWRSQEFDNLISQVDTSVNLKIRQDLLNRAEHLIYTEAPYIILSYPKFLWARRKDCFDGWGTKDMMSIWGYYPFDRLKPL
jgi:peptide/nickel transport system substrate-binding protein